MPEQPQNIDELVQIIDAYLSDLPLYLQRIAILALYFEIENRFAKVDAEWQAKKRKAETNV